MVYQYEEGIVNEMAFFEAGACLKIAAQLCYKLKA